MDVSCTGAQVAFALMQSKDKVQVLEAKLAVLVYVRWQNQVDCLAPTPRVCSTTCLLLSLAFHLLLPLSAYLLLRRV
jgi:hypothetical protein